ITDLRSGPVLLEVQKHYPQFTHIIGLGFEHETTLPWRTLLVRQSDQFSPVKTNNDTPALLLYQPPNQFSKKTLGALLPHKALIGNLPGFVASQNWFAQEHDRFWTSADWCSRHGLLNGVLPALYFGKPVVASLAIPGAAQALPFLNQLEITNAF